MIGRFISSALAALLLAAPPAAPAAQPGSNRSTGLQPVNEAGYGKLLSQAKGRVLVVDFWATWCVPCRAEMPLLVKLHAKYKDRGVHLVTISADEPEAEAGAAEFLKKTGVPAPRYIKRAADDDRFINQVDAKWSGALPALFLYDRQGKLVKSFIGETGMADLEAAIGKLL